MIELAKTKHPNNFFEAAFNTNDVEILTPILVANPHLVKELFNFSKSNKDVFTNAGFIRTNAAIGNHQIHSKLRVNAMSQDLRCHGITHVWV